LIDTEETRRQLKKKMPAGTVVAIPDRETKKRKYRRIKNRSVKCLFNTKLSTS
jgi:hypothetical protein